MNYILWYWKYGCCQIKQEWDRPADRGIDGSRGGMEMRKRRMGEVDVWILCAFMCWGGWVYSKGRERCRKWLEIADALRGLQKINSSQEGKPQPPTCSLSPCLLMLPSSHLSPPLLCYLLESLIPQQYRHLLCTSNTVLLWSLCIRIPRGRSRNFQSFGIGWKKIQITDVSKM